MTGSLSRRKIKRYWNSVCLSIYCLREKDRAKFILDGQPENHTNAPVGLALVGRRLEEEKVTAMLQVVSDIVGVDY